MRRLLGGSCLMLGTVTSQLLSPFYCCRVCEQPASMEPHAWPDDITKWPVSKPMAQSLYGQLERGICIPLCGATAVVLKVGWCSLPLVATNTRPGQPWPWLCPVKAQSPPITEVLLNQLKPWALCGNRVMVTGSASELFCLSERRCCLRLRQVGLKHHPAVRGRPWEAPACGTSFFPRGRFDFALAACKAGAG